MIGKKNMFTKITDTIREEGIKSFILRSKKYIIKKLEKATHSKRTFKDVLFISGCDERLPHPRRYRITHQREQLEATGLFTDEVYFEDIQIEQVHFYRSFVFFRCPYTDKIGKFLEEAKSLNKTIVYDIDDLVIDTKYTNQIKFVRAMSNDDKRAYDKSVENMGRLLRQCDFALTTTECLARELKNYIKKVYINRNSASEEMIRISNDALKSIQKKDRDRIVIGYFSGSITHNADLELIIPVLDSVMQRHKNVYLNLSGEIKIPEKLKKYEERVNTVPFKNWRELPRLIAEVDINIAPLENNVFNEAKSENKWVEAALVKVVTVASNLGAFKECISHGETGILCNTFEEWEGALETLITRPKYRWSIGEAAYKMCLEEHTSIRCANNLNNIFRKEFTPNYVFLLPGLDISGGIKVVLHHASILQRNGMDISLFVFDAKTNKQEYEGIIFPVVSLKAVNIEGHIDMAIATMWTTVNFLETYPNISMRKYLVQNFETDFYLPGDPLRVEANKTYNPMRQIGFLTISKWCQRWLWEKYNQEAQYAPNGISPQMFKSHKRKLDGKIRILVEGDCAVEYKNVDEAFLIVELLDKEKYEVWYMSYNAEPKEKYRVDKFLHKVPYDSVAQIYEECDILLKTSLLESFSYPPLEMMATGGYVIAIPNEGNVEYLVDKKNCLFYPPGNIGKARNLIDELCTDEEMQEKLYSNGLKTAEDRAWESLEGEILKIYSWDWGNEKNCESTSKLVKNK